MPDGREFRKGVPQGRHAHILLQRGQMILDQLFPGLSDQLFAAGAETINVGTDLAFCSPNGWLPTFASEMEIIGASRRLLDYVVYERLAEIENIMPVPPQMPRGGVILPMENGGWQVTLIGIGRDYPPTDEAGFLEFARSLSSPEIYEAIKEAQPITAPYGYRRAENRLRQFDKLPAYLEGFLAMGDAVYALNPVYGQGMTLAAIASQLLNDCIIEHQTKDSQADFTGLASRFHKQLGKELITPWQQALSPPMRMVNNYFGQVMQAMPRSAKVTDAFYRVQHMVAPPTLLMRPDMMLTVFKTNLTTRFSKS